MKQILTIAAFVLLAGAIVATLPDKAEAQVVKTELAKDAVSAGIFALNYISEPTMEVVAEYVVERAKGKVSDGYASTVYHPPCSTS